MTGTQSSEEKVSCIRRVGGAVDAALTGFFGKVGLYVGRYPWTSISLSLLFVVLCLIGVMEYETESRARKLWTADNR